MSKAIIINNLSFSVGKKTILEGINFSVQEGEAFSLFGASGCGKSTLLKIISGIIIPQSGEISVFGINPAQFNNENRTVATVWQSRALFPHLSVKENIWYGLKFKKKSESYKERKYEEIISLLKIEYLQNRDIKKLSGGEEQKIALARALVIEPKVLLLDEPFTGIDRLYKDKLREDLRELLQKVNCTFVFVSHDTDDIYSLSDRIAVIENHRITQIDSPTSLYNAPISKFIAESIGNFTIIPGRIAEVDVKKNIALVETALGIYSGLINKDISFQKGEKVFYGIRPDSYAIGAEKKMLANALFMGKEVKGNACKLLFKLGDGINVNLSFNNPEAYDLIAKNVDNATNFIKLSWDPQDALVLKN